MDPYQLMVYLLLFGWLLYTLTRPETNMCQDCGGGSNWHFPSCPKVKDREKT